MNKSTLKLLFFSSLLLGSTALAQQANMPTQDSNGNPVGTCGTPAPSDEWENWLQARIAEFKEQQQKNPSTQAITYIPVVVHIVHKAKAVGTSENIKAAQVQSEIDITNDCLAGIAPGNSSLPAPFAQVKAGDIPIRLCLAVTDPNGTTMAEPGIDRIDVTTKSGWTDPYTLRGSSSTTIQNAFNNTIKPQSIWDPSKYFNIWVGDYFDAAKGGLLGWATWPAGTNVTGMPTPGGTTQNDGVCMATNVFGCKGKFSAGYYAANNAYIYGITSAHEIGHWLGLRHISGDASCGNDYCNDTPQQKGGNLGCANGLNWGCPTYPFQANQCTGNTNGEMFQNFMDYSNDQCRSLFTADQSTRIQAVMASGTYRKPFSTASPNCALVGVHEYSAIDMMSIYPNPTSGTFTISGNMNNAKMGKLIVYNSIGEVVYKESISNTSQLSGKQVDIGKQPVGLYIVQLKGETETKSFRIIIE